MMNEEFLEMLEDEEDKYRTSYCVGYHTGFRDAINKVKMFVRMQEALKLDELCRSEDVKKSH